MSQLAIALARGFERDGHRVRRLDSKTGRFWLVEIPFLLVRLLRAIVGSDLLLIISASSRSLWGKDLPATVIALLLGKSVVLNFVGGAAVKKVGSWGFWRSLPFRLAHRVVVPTALFRDALVSAGLPGRYEVIPHVVELDPFLRISGTAGKPVLLAAKGLESYAGFAQLLSAFQTVRSELPTAEFWIAGEGPARAEMEAKIQSLGLEGVRLLGDVPHEEMPDWFAQVSVFLHGSRYESFGIALVEAMAAGRPPVSFAVGGIPDVVVDGETGFLVPFGDTEALAEKTLALLNDPGLVSRMGEDGRRHSQRYSWTAVGPLWNHLCHTLLTKESPTSPGSWKTGWRVGTDPEDSTPGK